ncbi:glutathione S-transferase family protein [Cochlodiniinecator piscidefendens]|uniref:glutathione S-transferase family protein n=1 Tax=Cochlodiniinecator piscidefendens TaxID=2715756 RepID=UPI001407C413|nr:glutathione S-transferase family protein [Cochlodiniinecator piscidefendens]
MFCLHYAPDNASMIIRLTLEELKVPYRCALVDRKANAQRAEHYTSLNPRGLIPVLETPDGAIFETAAILLWLSEQHNAMAPAPNSPERGTFLKWLIYVSNGLHTDLRQLFYPNQYVGSEQSLQDQFFEITSARVIENLTHLEDLSTQGHSWFNAPLSNGSPSIFDYYVALCLRWLALYPQNRAGWFDLRNFPNLFAFAQRLEQHPTAVTACAAEGLGSTPFSAPSYATPKEGSAT